MKYILALMIAIGVAICSTAAIAGGEKKEVCEMQKDKKTGNEVKVCKQVKVHKKVEGDKVPEPAKKK